MLIQRELLLVNYITKELSILNNYQGRKVLITGHTGFKGSWMCCVLSKLRAEVAGYSIDVPTKPSLYELSGIGSEVETIIGDVRDLKALRKTFDEFKPEIVIHMAAQPIVSKGYKEPTETFDVNLMGTVNVLECIRESESVKSAVIITTDKVYEIEEDGKTLNETCRLGGYDPYAASKACAELAVSAYKNSFFSAGEKAISTVRAGNVIGGGDFADNRIVPDIIRAAVAGETVEIRNPFASRPYQHVLDPIVCYLMLALRQMEDRNISGAYNIGPNEGSISNEALVSMICERINSLRNADGYEKKVEYTAASDKVIDIHETDKLEIDASKIQIVLGWRDRLTMEDAAAEIASFEECLRQDGDIREHIDSIIDNYLQAS